MSVDFIFQVCQVFLVNYYTDIFETIKTKDNF